MIRFRQYTLGSSKNSIIKSQVHYKAAILPSVSYISNETLVKSSNTRMFRYFVRRIQGPEPLATLYSLVAPSRSGLTK
jgi:hypothetical protein